MSRSDSEIQNRATRGEPFADIDLTAHIDIVATRQKEEVAARVDAAYEPMIRLAAMAGEPAMLQFHVAISLVGILSGLVMLYGLLLGRNFRTAIAVFFFTTILTSATGFPLPPFGFDPPRAVGVLSLILLVIAVAAFYAFKLGGMWRWIYVVTAMASLYLNVFVGVIQAFLRLPSLRALAPTQSEPPFVVTQLIVLVIFVALGVLAAIRFHPTMKANT